MGSQSRRFRASKIVDFELFNLVSLLFLCLGFLIRPADYGNMFRYANSGAFSWEQRRSEVITTANAGAFSLKQTTSEVIAIANSTSSNIFDGRCTVCGNYSLEIDYGNTFQYADPGAFSLEQETSEVFTLSNAFGPNFDGLYSVLGIYSEESVHLPLLKDWNSSWSYNLDFTRSFILEISCCGYCGSYKYHYLRSEERPKRFMICDIEQYEVVIDNKIPMGTSTESPLNLPSSAICLDSIQLIVLEFDHFGILEEELVGYFLTATFVRLRFLYTHFYKTIVHLLFSQGDTAIDFSTDETRLRLFQFQLSQFQIIGFKKKLCHIEECSNIPAAAYCEVNDLELRAKVISVILAGLITFVIISVMAWKRIRNVILFKSNNELDALILEESDLDESYLADQILYENLMERAVLVSEGSSGKVYKVRFLELECAMKVFHSYARMDFRKESTTLLNLSHPHVVKFFCCFRKSFIIMELMDEDLYSFITKIRERHIDYDMPLEVALDVMLQIAEGMSYLHHQGIAHQDLKSLNILLKLRGEFHDPDFQIIAKVADFGSARRFDPRYFKGFILVPDMNIGTRLWRAPELFHPRGGFSTRVFGVNPRVLPKPLDIYGFAVICSELITKQIPFSTDKDLRVAVLSSRIRGGHRPALPSHGCPEGLLALIMDCWHRDPVLRPEFHEVCARLIEVKSSWMSRGERLSES